MNYRSIPLRSVRINDPFWSPRQRLITDVTLPFMEKILRDEVPGAEKSHAISNFRMAAGEESGTFYGMVFQDSDVAKWLETAAYGLYLKPDAELEKRVHDVIDLIGRAQQPDGYLSTFFTVKKDEERWSNLLECHELYCAGHMMEAACGFMEATGDDRLLKIVEKLADHIIDVFGEDKREGVPGHQEIEIGLMRLYHVTGKEKYRDMALRFLNLRGQDPAYFIKNTPPHPGKHYGGYDIEPEDTAYNQSDVPVREQTKARGHAVRQAYMLAAMADAAASTSDEGFRAACERMFTNIVDRQMYVTGAIGSGAHHESFTEEFDLPNDRCYGETCASVAMAFFAREMLQLSPEARYADLLELELFNGALAGMELDGKKFFYVNPLEADPQPREGCEHVLPQRPAWHACACCPPNLSRLIASLGKYIYSESDDTIAAHLFIGSDADTALAHITQTSAYPWEGRASFTLTPRTAEAFTLAIRIPGYVKNYTLTLNGEALAAPVEKGYCRIRRAWQEGDRVDIAFDLPPRRIYADPRVVADRGRVALARGPIVYCAEGVDHDGDVFSMTLPKDAPLAAAHHPELLGGVTVITALAEKHGQPAPLTAIPYYAWSNRGLNQMEVWVREDE